MNRLREVKLLSRIPGSPSLISPYAPNQLDLGNSSAGASTPNKYLKAIYHHSMLFPSSPDIQDCEIQTSKILIGEGGQGTCVKGLFLGDQEIAMKKLKSSALQDEKIKEVGTCLYRVAIPRLTSTVLVEGQA